MRYLVVFENNGGYDYIKRKDVVTSYDINYWGDRTALRWAKGASACTKRTVIIKQTQKGNELIK